MNSEEEKHTEELDPLLNQVLFVNISWFLLLMVSVLLCLLWFSDCSTKSILWTYSAGYEEGFFLFCDLPEPQKFDFYHRSQLLPTQGPEHLPCRGVKDLADVQWYVQPQNGDLLEEITENYPHIIQDKNTLRFLTTRMNNAGTYICRPRIRYVPSALLSENIP